MTGAPARGAAAVAAAFTRARAEDRAALVVYLTAGFPDPATSRACIAAAAGAGADVIEVGLPFSDPIMDGPTIQAANQVVLDAGIGLQAQLAIAREGLAGTGVPGVAMTYVTVADTRGWTRFADDCVAAGLSGVILPDLPVPEAGVWRDVAAARDLVTVFLAASVSEDDRLDAIASASSGWVYAVGLLGVTGVDAVDDTATRRLVARVRARTATPIAVGIGVRDAADASRVAAYADGVIVGSALLRAIAAGPAGTAPDRVAELVAGLRAGLGRQATPR